MKIWLSIHLWSDLSKNIQSFEASVNAYKVIVIGLDGGTYDLIKPWAEEGKLPAFKQLLAEGTAGELCSMFRRDWSLRGPPL
jgi:predicted AlkP superfamily pyrophosphatase or phosphodiesterase